MLRASLHGKPLDLIKGVGSDYKAAWAYLDSIYGDPRFIADTVTQDITRFKPLQNGEDTRFCELVHLVNRSYNTLKEVGRPYDMNNNHMLAIIEQKMCVDDRKMWARDLEREKKEATLENIMSWMTTEMKSRMRSSAPVRSQGQGRKWNVNYASEGERFKCWVCKTSVHWVDQCPKVEAMTPAARLQLMKENRACFACLKKTSKNHKASTCSRRRQCSEKVGNEQCKSFHHHLLHIPGQTNHCGIASVNNNKNVLLPVIEVEILGQEGNRQRAVVLFDSGAQISLIRKSVAKDMKLKGKDVMVTLTKVGGEEEEIRTKLYKVRLLSLEDNTIHSISAVGIPCISDSIEAVSIGEYAQELGLEGRNLIRGSGSVDILIGCDHVKLHAGEIREAKNLIARHSPLGWVVFGPITGSQGQHNRVLHVQVSTPVNMTEFWSTEAMGVSSKPCQCNNEKLSPAEQLEKKVIEDSCKKVGKQWMVSYPWRRDRNLLRDNREHALKKLEATERRLKKNPVNAEKYNEQINEMTELNFARKLSKEEVKNHKGPVHYIAHREVLRPDKRSTPVRIVFNSSANYKGQCLNDFWMKGPDLLNNLFGVVLRFRENEVAFCADISKMYHRILIPKEDQDVHRFLWRNLETEREPDIYVKKVLTFGDKPAPAMAQIVLRKTAEEAKEIHPEASRTLLENSYVDDIWDSAPTEQKAKKITKEVDEILATGGFTVKGWLSNRSAVQVSNSAAPKNTECMKLLETNAAEKVLGLIWDNKKDVFSFKVNISLSTLQTDNSTELVTKKLTKRKILSQIARVFDPFGFAAAFIIKAKIGMQDLWERGIEWDEELTKADHDKWMALFEEMKELNNVTVVRCLTPICVIGKPTLCIFSDASEKAFGTCAYIRWLLNDGTFDVRFTAAKSRVAPLKQLTIPRLELQAAVLASRLGKTILEETRFQFEKVIYFVDSMIVLAWIQSQARSYKIFVSTRVREIQTNSNPAQWRHIPGEDNVADDVSRGVAVKNLQDRWLSGPDFLRKPEEEWPQNAVQPKEDEVNKERRKPQAVCSVDASQEPIDCKRFSKWRRLVRVTARIQRLAAKARSKRVENTTNSAGNDGILTPDDLRAAELYWIKRAQITVHKRVKNGELRQFSPFIDDEGVLRVGGRVDKALVCYDNKHPALLPYEHWISTLITRHAHEQGHSGIAATVAKLRRNYWILKAHNLAKKLKRRCVFCKSMEHKLETQLMAELPPTRLTPQTPPFFYTSCDYFGPYKVKISRNKTDKNYGVIFTCLNSRAIHLELATDYSAMGYMQVLRRFFCIRGCPKLILSDNGTQLVGVARELREMIRLRMGHPEIKGILRRKRNNMAIHHTFSTTPEWVR
ncbi:uncharacterized protein LOC114540191 [Dendronephthya gigantea]|uniref:uncharacterized protein LOC114540191 n=1 Tax=Dendronephthya gigantea TaxID=151771 RepID=UPI00106CE75B|nr:uncharacterized protein LOC114540191 [Dendronephthya gigantea]